MLIRKHANWDILNDILSKTCYYNDKTKQEYKGIVDYRPWATIQRITCCGLINKLKWIKLYD